MADTEPTKRQHFVSQLYLKRWLNAQKRVPTWVNEKISPRRTEEIAHARYFYEVFGINDSEYKFLSMDLERAKLPVVDGLFNDIIKHCRVIGVVEDSGVDTSEDASLNYFKKNCVENYYGIIENSVKPAYEIAVERRYSDLTLSDYQNILRFAVYQLARTPKVRENVFLSTEALLTSRGIRFERWYTLSMLITAERLFMTFVQKLYKLTFVENKTSQAFITNDNPVFNLRSIDDLVPELFWPLTPFQAVRISPAIPSESEANSIRQDWLKKGKLAPYFTDFEEEHSLAAVHELNKKAWENKKLFAFACKEEDLLAFSQD